MRIVTANKLNRLWKNGFLPKLGLKIDKTKVLTTVEQVAANTNAENIAGATAVKTIYNNLTNKMPGQLKLIAEGSGANVKYYAQLGADAASKKLLGNAKVKGIYIAKGTSSYSFTADAGYKFITAFLSRYEEESQHAFWSEGFEIHYAAGNATQNTITVSDDRKTITCPKLQTDYRFYLCGVEVPA